MPRIPIGALQAKEADFGRPSSVLQCFSMYISAGSKSGLIGLIFILLTACVTGDGTSPQTRSTNTHPHEDVATDCPWECANWGDNCMVDARGVQKCMRECRDFRRVCEKQ